MQENYEKLKIEEMKRLGNELKVFRIKENISQRELASKLNLSQTQITNAEKGKSQKAQNKVIHLLTKEFDLAKDYFEKKNKVDKAWDYVLDAATKSIEEGKDMKMVKPILIPESDSILMGKYMMIVEGSIAKATQLKNHLEEIDSKDLDKESLLQIVNELFVILSLKDEIM